MQRDAIERAAKARGDKIGRWYDDTFTGGASHPPGLKRLLQDARGGWIATLYVYRLDRLSRRGIADMLMLVETFQRAGVRIVSVSDGFDLQGPGSELVLAMIAWAAKWERTAILERIASARVRVEANGGKWGRPRRMTDEQETQARRMKAEGKTNRTIAAALGVPKSTVARIVAQKGGPKWGPRAKARAKLKRLRAKGFRVDLRKTKLPSHLVSR